MSPPASPLMSGPPVAIHVDENAKPTGKKRLSLTYFRKKLLVSSRRYLILGLPDGVIASSLGANQLIPRTVDLSPLNMHCQRETFSSELTFHIARRIPGNTWKTVCHTWNGYHSVPIRDSGNH